MKHRWLLLFATCGALLLGFGAGLATKSDPNSGYLLRERIWHPIEADGSTLGLFRMDQNRDADVAIEEAFEDVLAGGDDQPAVTTGSSGNVKDVSLHAINAKADGSFDYVREGKVDGAMRFQAGGSPRLVTASYPRLTGNGWRGTAEAWFRPDPGLAAETVVLALAMRSGKHLEVRRLADGRVVFAHGETVLATSDQPLLPAGAWRHVALVTYWAEVSVDAATRIVRPRAAGIRLLVDGEIVANLGNREMNWLWSDSAAIYWFGNRPAGDRPFVGLIDEVRLSDRDRLFYALDNEIVDPEAQRPLPEGWPSLRDASDIVLSDDFEPPAH